MTHHLLNLIAVLPIALVCGRASAGANGFFELEPPRPIAGEPFNVVAISDPCESLFVGNLYGSFNYGGVAISGSDVIVRIGRLPIITCDAPVRRVAQAVPPLPAGGYRLHLIYQSAPPDLRVAEIEVFDAEFEVAAAVAPSRIPASTWPSALVLIALLATGLGLHRSHDLA